MNNQDSYKTSRFFYVLEATFEYFISILVAGAYLAKVTSSIGMTDSLTGILTSFVSLGCGFQIIAIFLANKKPVKHWVTVLHTLNQLFFALCYLVPFVKISQEQKTVVFILFLLLGHIVNNVVNSPKINWFMSLVDNQKRGRFTAKKEIVSLIGGMLFSFIIGTVMDGYEAQGDYQSAFIFCGIGIFVLTVLHSMTLILSKEKPAVLTKNESTKNLFKKLISDKNLLKVIMISVLWNIAHYATTPFYGTYQIKELGFTMTFVSFLSILYAICRSTFSIPLGKFADKFTFKKMLNLCFIIEFVAFSINIFTVPENGHVFYTVYYVLYAVGMAGINSGAINLIYDYVNPENRTGALALQNTLAGFCGFLTTLIVSALVSSIQTTNTIFGISAYAQQVVSIIGAIVVLVTILYLNTAVGNAKKE